MIIIRIIVIIIIIVMVIAMMMMMMMVMMMILMMLMMLMMMMMMILLYRRKTTEVLSISVPDLHAREVRLMLDLFYQGSVSLSGTTKYIKERAETAITKSNSPCYTFHGQLLASKIDRIGRIRTVDL